MPKKKKKGAEKEKKAKKKPWLNERETVSYEQQILDSNRQLERLRSRNEYLEGEVDGLKAKLDQLQDDRSDVVAHLKRVLQQKTEEARELSDRLLAMEELRKEEQATYKKEEDAMQLEYRTMETNLNAEVKLAAGKLNALEDWRLARIDLMRKFEIQEEQMANQEEFHKTTLYEAEKSLVIGKAKMQKEMEERLNGLAQSFREATNIRIANATHRAIRENIALNLELNAIYKVCRKLDARMKDYKEQERDARIQSSLFQTETRMALEKLHEQNRLIDRLAEDHYKMTLEHGKITRAQAHKVQKEKIIQAFEEKVVEAEQKARILEQNIQKTREEREKIMKEWKDNCRKVQCLGDVLDTAKRYIADIALLLQKSPTENVCTPCYYYFEEKLRVLMDILEKQKIIKASADFSMLSVEYFDEYSRVSMNDSLEYDRRINIAPEDPTLQSSLGEDSTMEVSSIKQRHYIEADMKIPQCLLNNSQSSDVTSPIETETPPSTNSEGA